MGNYLVTGGAGFIGSHLVVRMVRDGHSVRVLDNFSTGRKENLQEAEGRFEMMEGDLRDAAVCRAACQGVDVIFHIGALPSVPKSVEEPGATHDCNLSGTLNVLNAAVANKCRRVIYAASSSAYGDIEASPKTEAMRPMPKSPYAVQKLGSEMYCQAFYECYKLETFSIRYFNVFGPRQDPKSQYAAAIPAFITSILDGEPPTIYGDGEQTRDFTYIDNIVDANLQAAAAPRLAGQVVNAACGEAVSLNQIIARINQVLGKNIKPIYTAARAGDVRHSLADNTLAKKLIGYEPMIDFAEGLARTIKYYQAARQK